MISHRLQRIRYEEFLENTRFLEEKMESQDKGLDVLKKEIAALKNNDQPTASRPRS